MSEPSRNQLPGKRDEKGLTQHQLSLKSGLRQSDISEYENGRTFPRPEAIEAIATALDEKPATVYEWLITPADPAPTDEEETAEIEAIR